MPAPTPAAPQPTEPTAPSPKPASGSAGLSAHDDAAEQQAVQEVISLKRSLRKVWMLIAGTVVIIVGIIISPLPGPGFTILGPLGLGMIASEFAWARRLLKQVQARASVVKHHTDSLGKQSHPVIAVLVVVCYWVLVWWMVKEFEGITAKVVLALSFPLFTPVALWAWAAFGLKTPWEKKKEREATPTHADTPSASSASSVPSHERSGDTTGAEIAARRTVIEQVTASRTVIEEVEVRPTDPTRE